MKKQDFKVLKTKDLYPFPDNPFHVAEDETLSELAESIKEFGIVTPIITRPKEDGDGYEVIAGQRRVRASELAGINTVPAFVLPLDRDRAIITLVDSNLQRENILPSERAFAYKMKSEAMKRQGFRTDLTSSQVVTKLRTDDKVCLLYTSYSGGLFCYTLNYPLNLFLNLEGFFYVLFSGSYLSAHTKQNLSIHSISENGRKPVKKISASATVLLTLKVEVQSPYNRITISYNRKGHRAFAVFLLSIFVGKCRRAVSDMRCRSPPLHLDFLHFKNSDGRYLW